MNQKKVLRRVRRAQAEPEVLSTVARDVGVALAQGDRDNLADVARELAANAPNQADPASQYWAGFAAALGMLLSAYDAAHTQADAREAALRAVAGDSAQAVLQMLSRGPATGAELSSRLGITPGGISKILKTLRGFGLARALGGQPSGEIPERGAPKPHVLTSLGISIASELLADTALTMQERKLAAT